MIQSGHGMRDGRTDGQTDRRTDGRSETSIPPQQLRCAGGIIKRYHLTSIGNAIMEIRRSYERLTSTMGFPILVRWHLFIESGPWHFEGLSYYRHTYLYSHNTVVPIYMNVHDNESPWKSLVCHWPSPSLLVKELFQMFICIENPIVEIRLS